MIMHRYSPSRNQRSKGIKIKHVLKVCFLIAVCCWLYFQIKRSHYKRKDLVSVETGILSSTRSDDEALKLGRKDLQPKETETREEEDEEHEGDDEDKIEDEKDDEIDEHEQYKFEDEDDTVNEGEEKDSQGLTANEAREEHYKADDASSAVTHEHEAQTVDKNGEFLETKAKIQEKGSESVNIVNISSDHSHNDSDSTPKESEPSLKLTNESAVVESQTVLTSRENKSGFLKTEDETEDPDEFQQDAIDSTDFIRLEDVDAHENDEDPVAE